MISIFREDDLNNIPALYEQDGKGSDATVYLKIQIPFTGYIWLITEYSPEEEIFFGFVCLNDIEMSELGYISKQELEDLGRKYPLTIEKMKMNLAEAKLTYILGE